MADLGGLGGRFGRDRWQIRGFGKAWWQIRGVWWQIREVWEGSVADPGDVVADLGIFFSVTVRVMADLGIFPRAVADLGIFPRVVADLGIFPSAVANLGTLGKSTRQTKVWRPK